MQASPSKLTQPDPSCIRFGKRTRLELPVQLTVAGEAPGRGVIRNASISGAYIETSLDLPLNTPLVVTATAPGELAAATHALNACVTRVDAEGVGIEWRDMASIDVLALLARVS